MSNITIATASQDELESWYTGRADSMHKTDSLNILMFICLLCLVLLTMWLLKSRRVRFIHETGLAIFYGFIIGALIKYATKPQVSHIANAVIDVSGNNSVNTPPDVLMLSISEAGIKNVWYEMSSIERTKMSGKKLQEKASFSPEIFFNLFLPPIIFNAGYSMKRRHFFVNFGSVLTFAFVGTSISCVVVGSIVYGFSYLMNNVKYSIADSFFFGSLISATDPVTILVVFNDINVDVTLYALVFGESVLNDAVAIVLSGIIETYAFKTNDAFLAIDFFKAIGNFLLVFLVAISFGVIGGVVSALVTKYTHIRNFPLIETSLFVLLSFATYQLAEVCGYTGIVAILFCGIVQAHYTFNNLSVESKRRSKDLFELLSFMSENFVFLYMGVSLFTVEHYWIPETAYNTVVALFAILIGRALNVYPLSFLLNLGRKNKIPMKFQHMMFFSGLRGAVAFALASRGVASNSHEMMLIVTLLVVIVTVIFCGGFTFKLLTILDISVGEAEEIGTTDTVELGAYRRYDSFSASDASEMNGKYGSKDKGEEQKKGAKISKIFVGWHKIDRNYVKPFLTHSKPTLEETLPASLSRIGKFFTSSEQRDMVLLDDVGDDVDGISLRSNIMSDPVATESVSGDGNVTIENDTCDNIQSEEVNEQG